MNGRSDDLITPKSIASSMEPDASNNWPIPVDVAATSNAFGYEARKALIAGSKASERPNGDASIANIDRAG
jgi:hypothetical protein